MSKIALLITLSLMGFQASAGTNTFYQCSETKSEIEAISNRYFGKSVHDQLQLDARLSITDRLAAIEQAKPTLSPIERLAAETGYGALVSRAVTNPANDSELCVCIKTGGSAWAAGRLTDGLSATGDENEALQANIDSIFSSHPSKCREIGF